MKRPLALVSAEMAAELHRRQQVLRVIRKGERPATELNLALAIGWSDQAAADRLIDQYAAIDPDALRVTGADKLPPSIIRKVSR